MKELRNIVLEYSRALNLNTFHLQSDFNALHVWIWILCCITNAARSNPNQYSLCRESLATMRSVRHDVVRLLSFVLETMCWNKGLFVYPSTIRISQKKSFYYLINVFYFSFSLQVRKMLPCLSPSLCYLDLSSSRVSLFHECATQFCRFLYASSFKKYPELCFLQKANDSMKIPKRTTTRADDLRRTIIVYNFMKRKTRQCLNKKNLLAKKKTKEINGCGERKRFSKSRSIR